MARPSTPLAIALGGLIALAAAMGIGRFVLTPILPFMIQDLGLNRSLAGLIASANFVGYLVGAFAAAASALPGGRRSWLIAALLVSALSTALMGTTTSLALFVAYRLAGGLASAFVLVVGSALVLDALDRSGRPGLAALHFAGVGAGIAASAILVAALARSGLRWPALWLASGGLALLGTGLVAWLVPAGADGPHSVRRRSPIPGNATFLLGLVAYGLFGFGYVVTATFLSTIIRSMDRLRPIEPYIWLIVGLAAIPSVAVWTWIARRSTNATAFVAACVTEALGVASSALGTTAAAQLAGALLLGGTFMGITALGLVRARDLTVGDPRRALALMTAAFGLGQILGPVFAGTAAQASGSFRLPSLVAAAALLAAAILVAVAPSPRRV